MVARTSFLRSCGLTRTCKKICDRCPAMLHHASQPKTANPLFLNSHQRRRFPWPCGDLRSSGSRFWRRPAPGAFAACARSGSRPEPRQELLRSRKRQLQTEELRRNLPRPAWRRGWRRETPPAASQVRPQRGALLRQELGRSAKRRRKPGVPWPRRQGATQATVRPQPEPASKPEKSARRPCDRAAA